LSVVFFAFFLMGIMEIIGVGSIGPFISVASNPGIIRTNRYLDRVYNYFNFSSDTSFIYTCGVGVIIVLCLSKISLAGMNFIIYYFSAKCKYGLSIQLLEKYLRQPYIFFLNMNIATLSNRLLGQIAGFVQGVLLSSLQLISASIVSFFIIVLLIVLNPLLAILTSAVLGSSYLFIFLVIRKYITRKGREIVKYEIQKSKCINETFWGIKDIKILSKEKVFINLFKTSSLKSAMNGVFCELAGDLPKVIIESVTISGIIVVILSLIRSGHYMDEFLPILTIYAFGAYKLLPLLQTMYRAISNLKVNTQIIEDLSKDFLELPPGTPLVERDIPRMPFRESITLSHVSFSYPNTEKDVIRDQSLVIKHNSSIALVGATGCGKTTLVDIILGLLEPQEGEICVDGVKVSDANVKNWQKNLGYVPQSIFLTDDTIRNNIAFGIDPDHIDDQAMENAAKMANIHDFVVNELRDGYNTLIGDRGIRLSGGQRQRIGIARAIYHDPSVLILDEATSALDSLTEAAIMDAIGNLNNKKTIIMIAHRLTTVKGCDIIYMMDRGIIVDQGTFRDLYVRNRTFKRLADGK